MRRYFSSFILSLIVLMSGSFAQAAEEKVVFAGGCFWCMESDFEKVPGVIEAVSGYAGGHADNPSYKQVSAGGTGHYEVVQVTYDTDRVSYEGLLETYWANVDPLDAAGQFCDKGDSYRTAIFYSNTQQKKLAETSKASVSEILGQGVATAIIPLKAFYPAEDYHQDYYKKNSVRYKFYRWNCGRDARLDQLWGENAHSGINIF